MTEKENSLYLDRLEKIFKSSPSIIALIYAAVGMAWILYSDQLALSIFQNTETLTRVQSYKGFFFVAASGVLIYFLVKKSNDMLEDLFRQLTITKDKLATTFEHTPIGIAHLDSDSGEVQANRELTSITGYREEEIIGSDFIEILNPEDPDEIRQLDRELMNHGIGQYKVTRRFHRKDGSRYTGDLTKSSVFDKQQNLLYVIAVLEDISNAVKNREELKKSLTQKEALLSEVHHRVRNNLALMSAMLELELMHSEERLLNQILIHYKTRLKSISLVYDYYSEKNGDLIVRFGECVENLILFMNQIFENREQALKYHRDIGSISLDINQAIPAILIYNELLMHANGQPNSGSGFGDLLVKLDEENGTIRFELSFDRKFHDESDLFKKHSLNHKLLKSFIDQLSGDWEIRNPGESTSIIVTFRKSSELGSANHLNTLDL